MTVDEIRAELGRCGQLPQGRAKAQRLESLAEQARQADDRALEAHVLLSLSRAYEFSSERERTPVPIGRLLQLLDTYPAEVGELSHTIHWQLKWLGLGLIRHPAVPLPTVHRWLDECESRYRQRGYSPRPVHGLRGLLALALGDDAETTVQMEAALAAPRDQMADCAACEDNDWGTWRSALGDDEGALEYWAEVLNGTKRCSEEPHRTLAKALLPLLRTGRTEEARGSFLRGYPLVRQNISLMAQVGHYIEFCALTGNEARGLEIVAEHTAWMSDEQVDADSRLAFLTGVCVLLRRLTLLGHGELAVRAGAAGAGAVGAGTGGAGTGGAGTVASSAERLNAEIAGLCAQYDERNGNTAVTDKTGKRLAQEPLLDFLPLGLPTKLPSAVVTSPGPVPRETVSAQTLDDLIAEAERLAVIRHPDAGEAWERIAARAAADETELPAGIEAKIARARAGHLMRADLGAAHQGLLDAAGRFASAGDLDGRLESLASAALAQALTGDFAKARESIAAVEAEAEPAFAENRLTPRYYLNVWLSRCRIELHVLDATGADAAGEGATGADAAGEITALRSRVQDGLNLADERGQPYHAGEFHDMLAQLSARQGDGAGMRAHFEAALAVHLDAGQPWCAVSPEVNLARIALQDGDAARAERFARDALAHGGNLLDRADVARISSLIADAVGRQPGREADLVDASLAAAARWDGLSEPDTLHNTFNAARAYAKLGRHGEAAALFAQAIGKVDVPYDGRGIAMVRDQYARSLRAVGQHAEAAEQFLEAVRLLDGDQENAGPRAYVAALAAEELQRSGRPEIALPAFRRAGDLFEALGDVVGRARCLRSAAWLEFDADDQTPYPERSGVAVMRSVLAFLESASAGESASAAGDAPDLETELDSTRKQLDAMLNAASEDD